MNSEDFKNTLKSAQEGDAGSIEKIIELYMPLIDRNSYIYEKFDEDLRQYLILKIYLSISKFKE